MNLETTNFKHVIVCHCQQQAVVTGELFLLVRFSATVKQQLIKTLL